jgi:hypothetical protein
MVTTGMEGLNLFKIKAFLLLSQKSSFLKRFYESRKNLAAFDYAAR